MGRGVSCGRPVNFLCLALGFCLYRDVGAIVTLACEDDCTVDQSIEGMVLTDTDTCTWVVLCATLTNDDVPSLCSLTTEKLYTKSFAL